MKKIVYLFTLIFSFYISNAQKVKLGGTKWCFVFEEAEGRRKENSPLVSVKFNMDGSYTWGTVKGKFSTQPTDDNRGYKTLILFPDKGLKKTYKVKYLDTNYLELLFNDGITKYKSVLVVCNDLSEF